MSCNQALPGAPETWLRVQRINFILASVNGVTPDNVTAVLMFYNFYYYRIYMVTVGT